MTGRVKFLSPLPPEKLAYALARYSRSSDPVEKSLAWVDEHSEERFWETFYFDYGHASIADLGHVAVCFEGVSELAAMELVDEPLWDGQARSTRYQDFSTTGHVTPPELEGHELEPRYHEVVRGLVLAYLDVHARAAAWLEERHPRPDDMKERAYERNVAARAFDMARYLLPLAVPTNVGQVTSIRTLEKQVSRLLASPLHEVRAIGEELVRGCRESPVGGGPPPAPTLARHARRSEFAEDWRLRAHAATRALGFHEDSPRPWVSGVTLLPRTAPAVELLTGLLYEHARRPWGELAERVEGLPAEDRSRRIAEILAGRGPHDELPRPARVGHEFAFEVVMDVGGWRDLHRHRRCHQLLQEPDLGGGLELPPDARSAGIDDTCQQEYEKALELAMDIHEELGPWVAGYVLPLMHRVRCVFKMDFAEIDYIARLRTGVKGHPSYRRVAWDMYQAACAAQPELAHLLDATPPEVEDPLTR